MSSPAASGWISITTSTASRPPTASCRSDAAPQASGAHSPRPSTARRLLEQGVAVVVGRIRWVAPGDRRALLDEQTADVVTVGVHDVSQRPIELVDIGGVDVSHTGPLPTSSTSASVASAYQHSPRSGVLMPIRRTVILVSPRATSMVSPSTTSVTSHGSPGGGVGSIAVAGPVATPAATALASDCRQGESPRCSAASGRRYDLVDGAVRVPLPDVRSALRGPPGDERRRHDGDVSRRSRRHGTAAVDVRRAGNDVSSRTVGRRRRLLWRRLRLRQLNRSRGLPTPLTGYRAVMFDLRTLIRPLLAAPFIVRGVQALRAPAPTPRRSAATAD